MRKNPMKSTTEKQILEWKEELAKQIKTKDHAKKVFDEATVNINVLEGGIQFGELLLKKNESSTQQSNIMEQAPQTKTSTSQK